MLGALMGDVIGSRFESSNSDIPEDFRLLDSTCHFTDDTVMTIAVAEALRLAGKDAEPETISHHVTQCMQKWGRKYPHAGYGRSFKKWMYAEDPQPYHSWGNGSAMRVSPAGWLYDSLERTREVARATAIVTHDHPEGIKGAECTAALIYLARNGFTKEEMAEYAVTEFGYDFHESLEEMKLPHQHRRVSCMDSLPKAIRCFLDGNSFEEVVRKAVSLGGDTDTVAAIAGSIAEAMYGVDGRAYISHKRFLAEEILEEVERFEDYRKENRSKVDIHLHDNELIEQKIRKMNHSDTSETAVDAIRAVKKIADLNGYFMVPVNFRDDTYACLSLPGPDGKPWAVAFTSQREAMKGPKISFLTLTMNKFFRESIEDGDAGILINPYGDQLALPRDIVKKLVPPEPFEEDITPKEAVARYKKDNRVLADLLEVLARSEVYIPCRAAINENENSPDGRYPVDFVPELLKDKGDFFFPLFTSIEEMQRYYDFISRVPQTLEDALTRACLNENKPRLIVLNPFTDNVSIWLSDCIRHLPEGLRETLLNLTCAQ